MNKILNMNIMMKLVEIQIIINKINKNITYLVFHLIVYKVLKKLLKCHQKIIKIIINQVKYLNK